MDGYDTVVHQSTWGKARPSRTRCDVSSKAEDGASSACEARCGRIHVLLLLHVLLPTCIKAASTNPGGRLVRGLSCADSNSRAQTSVPGPRWRELK